MLKPLLITIPHAGERVPPEAPWLAQLPERLLMFDVDRYVDRLYAPAVSMMQIPLVKTEWHRYAADLNRWPSDVDVDSVDGSTNASGQFPRGFHWSITTTREKLMPSPMPMVTHEALVKRCFEPFHAQIKAQLEKFRASGALTTFQLDAHSCPSRGTSEHRDPGETRAEIIVSDCEGKSCSKTYRDMVVAAYETAGFRVAVNWPYKGGRVTETYGRPAQNQEAIQVEMSRALYMNEETKQLESVLAEETSKKIARAVHNLYAALPYLP